MNLRTKIYLLHYTVFLGVFLMLWFAFELIFEGLDLKIQALLCAVIARLLSPKIKTVDSQAGQQIQLKWFFLEKSLMFYHK